MSAAHGPMGRWRIGWFLLLASALLLAACATPPARHFEDAAAPRWSGRLALRLASDAMRSFSANFELRGSPQAGELAFFTPLGSTAAVLSWAPGWATLQQEGQAAQQFGSLDDLVSKVTGTSIPVPALFDWLAGIPTTVQGWTADLSQRDAGRLQARRISPEPAADLRLVLDLP